ncbi:hypothetical protein CQZ94_27935 [Bacillus sp. MYb209]|uniref:hypothetical protein n=1 Tax=Bacillus sp. MYb209 TaxID=1848605 RepID=UPI000CFCA648|nr:hypothetical protein [Bacillus sp. MYb209]PQZ48528.1 hypothetical protein CQZ94_27935 [Bacillus sp. MYb209]
MILTDYPKEFSFLKRAQGVAHTHQLKKNKGPKIEKMSRTLMNNCEKVKFLLWEVSENLSLMGMGYRQHFGKKRR